MPKNPWNQSGGNFFDSSSFGQKKKQEWTRLLGPTCSLFGSAVITPSQILAWPSGDQPWSSLTSEQKQNLKLVEKLLVLVLVQAVPVQAWMTASKIWWITHQVGPPWPDILNRLGQRTCSGIRWPIFSSFVKQFVCTNLYQVKELIFG